MYVWNVINDDSIYKVIYMNTLHLFLNDWVLSWKIQFKYLSVLNVCNTQLLFNIIKLSSLNYIIVFQQNAHCQLAHDQLIKFLELKFWELRVTVA